VSLRVSEVERLFFLGRDCYRGAFTAVFFLDDFHRVLSRGYTFDGKTTVLTRDKEERMADYGKVRSHPWMHRAGDRKPDFLPGEGLELLVGLGRLRLVPGDVRLRLGMNVVIYRVGVIDFELLADHQRENVRSIDAAILIEDNARLGRIPPRLRQAFLDPDEGISNRAVRVDDDGLGGLRGSVLALTHRIGRHVDRGHHRLFAFKEDLPCDRAGRCWIYGGKRQACVCLSFGRGGRMTPARTHQ